jgi:hypothetical protein
MLRYVSLVSWCNGAQGVPLLDKTFILYSSSGISCRLFLVPQGKNCKFAGVFVPRLWPATVTDRNKRCKEKERKSSVCLM